METSEARKKLEEQLEKVTEKIKELETNLVNFKEFKLKVQGGLETLDMLESSDSEEINNSET